MIDTHGHMVAAYIVASVIYILYSLSLYLRARKYRSMVIPSERGESRDLRT